MKQFKFFQKDEKPTNYIDVGERTIALLPNEQVINYTKNDNTSGTRVIAWGNRTSPRWTLTRFIGTMEQFFRGRMEIPVIKYIERGGVSISMIGTEYPLERHFRGEVYYIYYYEYEDI